MQPPSRPRRWLAPLVILALGGCAEPGADVDERAPDGALRGEVVTYVMDFADRSETQYMLRLADGQERRLVLDGHPDLGAGDRLRVWGRDVGDALQVTRFEREPLPIEAHRSALIGRLSDVGVLEVSGRGPSAKVRLLPEAEEFWESTDHQGVA